MKRSIKKQHKAQYAPMGSLLTYRAMPTQSIDYLDPFLFVNHHGPQTYGRNNEGLPFGPHPHRGFETLTYILKGDIMHWDSSGAKSVIEEGGVQWMTAGSGLIHSEVSSEEFRENGGEVEVIQLWLNLPAAKKMVPPNYVGLSKEELCYFDIADGKGEVMLISGTWGQQKGPINAIAGLTMAGIELQKEGTLSIEVPTEHEVLFYLVRGEAMVNGLRVPKHTLVEFDKNGKEVHVEAVEDAYIIFGHGAPLNEPVAAHGPFVMNTQQEIMQAFKDYEAGKMGVWQ